MRMRNSALALALVTLTAATSSAQWNAVSDFESIPLGALGNQGGWTSELGQETEYAVTADPDNPANQVLRGTGSSTAGTSPTDGNAYISLGANSIADNSTGTVFFRARTSDMSNFVFGAADVAAPFTWSSYEGYMVMDAAGGTNSLRVRDGGGFSTASLEYTGDEWYNIWLVLDHTADETSLYASQGTDAAALIVTGDFRTNNEPTDDLVSLNLRMGGSHLTNSAEGYLDDIYVDNTGANLTIPEGISMPALPGDVNLDGFVNAADYVLIRDNFRTAVADPTLGDLTGPNGGRDGFVDFYDFGEWKANASPAVLASVFGVPEPTSLVLLAGCLAASAVRRR